MDGDHSKGNIVCDLFDSRVQRLSVFQAFSLLSDKIRFDSFTATINIHFEIHDEEQQRNSKAQVAS